MSILSAQSIHRRLGRTDFCIAPYVPVAKQYKGLSYGLSSAGYDIRLGTICRDDGTICSSRWIGKGDFVLAAALEYLKMPDDLVAEVKDKSTWARKGLAVQNTIIEPGWCGYLTLELSMHAHDAVRIETGMPIAQLVFSQLDAPTDIPYTGKYQNQSSAPQPAITPEDKDVETTK